MRALLATPRNVAQRAAFRTPIAKSTRAFSQSAAAQVNTPSQSELGRQSTYKANYDPSLLFPIPREQKRRELGILESTDAPWLYRSSFDQWTSFEVSWLNAKTGQPEVRVAVFDLDADSRHIIESKSFKLYLNSFNGTKFADAGEVARRMEEDLTNAAGPFSLGGSACRVRLFGLEEFASESKLLGSFKQLEQEMQPLIGNFAESSAYFRGLTFTSLDENGDKIGDMATEAREPTSAQLETSETNRLFHNEVLTSELLKSNCLVTGQPDWGSVVVKYRMKDNDEHFGRAKRLDQRSLLKYIVSFRNHNEFHEQCVERIFNDVWKVLTEDDQLQDLLVYARYTRRGGLDINPLRFWSMDGDLSEVQKFLDLLRRIRLVRQ